VNQVAFRNEEEVSTPKGRLAPDDLPTSFLLSAGYDGKQEKAFLRLYEPVSQQVYLWYDNTGHLSYCISKETPEELRKNDRLTSYPGFMTLEQVEKFDAIADETIKVTKVVATNPLAIGGGAGGGVQGAHDGVGPPPPVPRPGDQEGRLRHRGPHLRREQDAQPRGGHRAHHGGLLPLIGRHEARDPPRRERRGR
jgi:hypothetical protein